MDYWLIFVTGLTVGGLTCVTVQGGLLASTIAARVGSHKKPTLFQQSFPVLAFLFAKLFAYSLLGLLLGQLGDSLTFNDLTIVTLQILAGLYMIGLALNFLKVHPVFRYLIPHPPEFLSSMLSAQSESRSLFAPAFLGFLTVFIPCGTTLAMEALAISTGNPWTAAAVMAVFVIGTFPLFLVLGVLTSSARFAFKTHFYKVAAILIIILGLYSINGSLVVLDAPFTLQKLYFAQPIRIAYFEPKAELSASNGSIIDGVQIFNIKVTDDGYEPRYIKVSKSKPVRLNLITKGVYNCALAFRIPPLKIAKNLKPNSVESVEFTPTQAGKLYYSCSMGMYIGIIEVE